MRWTAVARPGPVGHIVSIHDTDSMRHLVRMEVFEETPDAAVRAALNDLGWDGVEVVAMTDRLINGRVWLSGVAG